MESVLALSRAPDAAHEGAHNRAAGRSGRGDRGIRGSIASASWEEYAHASGAPQARPWSYAAMTIRRSGPGVVKRRVPWASGSSPKALSARGEAKASMSTRNTRGAGTRNEIVGWQTSVERIACRAFPARRKTSRGEHGIARRRFGHRLTRGPDRETAKRCAGTAHNRSDWAQVRSAGESSQASYTMEGVLGFTCTLPLRGE